MWIELKQQMKIKNNMIGKSKREYLKQKAATTMSKNRSKPWYDTVNETGNIHKSTDDTIDRIITHE